ncbi:MAG: ornithine cyclodeaminase family protein [Janthinobacterium lividum]
MLGAHDVALNLDYLSLIAALDAAFRGRIEAPARHHHTIAVPGGSDATLLLMPAWMPGCYIGTKVAPVFPDNGTLGLPAVQAAYLLFSGRNGQLLATLDGSELTTRRTVAASSLAVRYLARSDASRLLIVGTGRVAGQLAASHAAVRPIRDVEVWGRDAGRAAALADRLVGQGFNARGVTDLRAAVATADIVSCCTLSREPLIAGAWLLPGVHLDLIGGFTPAMREVDDTVMARAVITVDTFAAVTEAGDLVVPLRNGVICRDAIQTDLAGLVTGAHPGRRTTDEITLFKSVGASIEDLAAAVLCYQRAGAAPGAN